MTSHQLFKPSMITFALSFFAFRVAYLPFVMFKVFTLEQFTFVFFFFIFIFEWNT